MAKKLLKRSEVPMEHQWDTTAVYLNTAKWEEDFANCEKLIKDIPPFEGTLNQSGQRLLDFFTLDEKISAKLENLYLYAKMNLDTDNNVSLYQGMKERMNGLYMKVSEASAFVVPEIIAISEEKIEEMLRSCPGLELYHLALTEIRRFAPYTLTKREEEIMALSGDMAGNASTAFAMFNNADLKFPIIKDSDGDDIEITHANFISLMESHNREIRKKAFQGLYATYNQFRNTLAALLIGDAKSDAFSAKVRGCKSTLWRSLFADNVPEDLYDTLIETVHNNLDAFYDYLALRKEVLGVDELHYYDIYVPMIEGQNRVIPFEEGFNMVREAVKPLGEEYCAILERALTDRWLDYEPNEGKTSGAYSWGSYHSHPYILMSYQENLDSVFTLIHELGHSMHSFYSWRTQPYVYSSYTIFVAEVASTVNEALLTQYLLEHSTDKNERIFLLNKYLDEFRGTLFRQTMFAEFEKIFHSKVENYEGLTAEDLCTIYGDLNRLYFGDNIVHDDEIDMEWARIPHFYNSFYVYKYATGFTAAATLSQKILSGDKKAVEAYLNFLSGGSSKDPLDLLKDAGVDLLDPKALDSVFTTYRQRLAELRELLQK